MGGRGTSAAGKYGGSNNTGANTPIPAANATQMKAQAQQQAQQQRQNSDIVTVNGKSIDVNNLLSATDINRANAASVMSMGDIINNMVSRGAKEISQLNLSESRKEQAIQDLTNLGGTALTDAAKAVNPYASGRARLTTAQMNGSAANKAAASRGAIDNYMNSIRSESSKNTLAASNANLTSVLSNAMSTGQLQVTVNGKTYYRKTKRSTTWSVK